ncbi:hypothetical protein V6N13_123925 [Hibiscus sabdariffa]
MAVAGCCVAPSARLMGSSLAEMCCLACPMLVYRVAMPPPLVVWCDAGLVWLGRCPLVLVAADGSPRSSRTWAGLLVYLRKVSPCSPVVLCLVRSSGASGCPCPRWSGSALGLFLVLQAFFLGVLASPILCLLNCIAPLGGVVQYWPGLAQGLLVGDRHSGRYARVAAHPAAWLLIVAAIVIACVLAGPAQYCPRLLPCPASVLS